MYGKYGLAVRDPANGQFFLAWGCVGPTSGQNPIDEPAECWFNFGTTAEKALQNLRDELDAQQ
jgi:hypothetical protein